MKQDALRGTTGYERLVMGDSDVEPVLSVVLPTLNEERGIGECLTAIETALAELGVTGEVIVSDSSTDRTPEIARAHGARVVEPDREGYGYAYRYGFQFARGDYVVMGDADTTYDFEELPKLMEPILRDEADLVLGSRFMGEIKPEAMPPLHRYVGNPLLTRFLNVFYDAGVTDAHSGFRVLRRELIEEMDFTSDGMEFASEMIMVAAMKGLRIEEVPIVYHEREGEETLDSLQDGWRHVKFMLMNAPGHLFTLPGGAFVSVGLLVMVVSVLQRSIGSIYFGSYTMLGGVSLTLIGSQIGSLGIFSSVAANPIRDPSDPVTHWVGENAKLEHGATAGLLLFAIGAVVAAYLLIEWVNSGYADEPSFAWLIAAFGVALLGLQAVFHSFFLSMLAGVHD
jgi:glycosyltransferase involved in cell wall biosynthesis